MPRPASDARTDVLLRVAASALLTLTRGIAASRGFVQNYQAAGTALIARGQPATTAFDPSQLNFSCELTVPPIPPSWDGNTTIYLWCGVNWYDKGRPIAGDGVMQPVLTFGCSPNAFSGVGCNGSQYNASLGYPTGGPDRAYGQAPYWYVSAQYVLGWGPGMARGSRQMIRTAPGRTISSEVSYDAKADSWLVGARDPLAVGVQASYLHVPNPSFNASRTWRALLQDNRTEAAAIVAVEPQQVTDPRRQMPKMEDYRVLVTAPAAALPWNVNPGSSARVLQGGRSPEYNPTIAGFDLQWQAPPPPPPAPPCASYKSQGDCPGWPQCVWSQGPPRTAYPTGCMTPPLSSTASALASVTTHHNGSAMSSRSTLRFFPATSEGIRVVGRTARAAAAATSLYFDWSSVYIIARLTGPATIVLHEAQNSSKSPQHQGKQAPGNR